MLLVALGVVYNLRNGDDAGGGVQTKGTVVSVRRDSLGCATWIPFARPDCRVVVKIRHRPEGANADVSLLQASVHRFSNGPPLAAGDAVNGTCDPSGSRCH